MKVTIDTDIKNGSPVNNRKLISEAFKQFEGKRVSVSIQLAKKSRSNPQNKYYWGVLIPEMQQGFKETWGEKLSQEEVHEFCKLQFNYVERVNEVTGEIIRTPKSTTLNSTASQEEYHEQIRQFAFEWFNIVIQLPDKEWRLKFE